MARDDQDLAPPPLRLDDDFVRNARFKEGSAQQRQRKQARAAQRAEKRRAKAIKRQWRKGSRLQAKDWLLPIIALVAALYIFKLPPFRPPSSPSVRTGAAGAAGTAVPGETTSTTYTLERLSYRVGECVLWDQRKDGPGTRDTQVVGCDRPHLIEITGRATVPDAPVYPPDSEWDRLIQNGECGRLAREHLGGELDPYGRFTVGAIHPSRQSWNDGDRELWCGLQAAIQAADHDLEVSELFTGTVHSQPQALLWPTGSCLGGQPGTGGTIDGIVPCTSPHLYEIAGSVDAAPRFTSPPPASSPLWANRLGRDCEKVAKVRFGGRIPAGVQSAVFHIDPASWRAGRHTTECAVARYDPATKEATTLGAPLLPSR